MVDVVLVDVIKEVRQPCLDIDSDKSAAAHHRVHHGGIVVLAEEVVLAGLCTALLVFSSFKKQPNIFLPTVWGERRGVIPQTFQ